MTNRWELVEDVDGTRQTVVKNRVHLAVLEEEKAQVLILPWNIQRPLTGPARERSEAPRHHDQFDHWLG